MAIELKFEDPVKAMEVGAKIWDQLHLTGSIRIEKNRVIFDTEKAVSLGSIKSMLPKGLKYQLKTIEVKNFLNKGDSYNE